MVWGREVCDGLRGDWRLFWGVILAMGVTLASTEILYAETASISFDAWAADLKPGFMLTESTIGGRTCFCKKPVLGTHSSVFNFPGGGLSAAMFGSSGVLESSYDMVFIQPPAPEPEPEPVFDEGVNTTTHQPTTTTTVQAEVTSTTTACSIDCNKDLTIDDGHPFVSTEWWSPGWDKGENYPDGCLCVLTVMFRSSRSGVLDYQFASGSDILAINSCGYDHLLLNMNGDIKRVCDNELYKSNSQVKFVGGSADYIFTFVSDPADGWKVSTGFKITINGLLF